jgi:hypothetical protein
MRVTAQKNIAYDRSSVAPPLPANLEAERSILGAILLDNHALQIAAEKIRTEDFFLSQHRHEDQGQLERKVCPRSPRNSEAGNCREEARDPRAATSANDTQAN